MSALFDFPALLTVLLLFICTTAFIRSLYPTIFDTPVPETSANPHSFGPSSSSSRHSGLKGICWKASRVGERLSPYIGAACVVMAFHLLFIKP